MAYGGEVASMFVRIRPNLGGFRAEAAAGVKSALAGVQTEVNAAARANVAGATRQVEANRALAASYQKIGAAAARGSDEARVAAKLAADATVAANEQIGLAAKQASDKVGFLRQHLLNLGSALGIGFGAAIGVKFVKDLTDGAASVQKSVEVIRKEFGASSSDVVVKFGDTVAAKLGISAQLADTASAKFGILFKNLGISQPVAARMTIGFEQLVGSLSAIRGVDPSTIMQNITLAAAGNTRGLKQLGIVVDANTEKLAAFKLGLIQNLNTALSPAVKTEAIYAIATAHLGEFQRQAAAKAGDYANVQRRLSAEWANAKDIIGTALLPVFTTYITKLADWLGRMNQSGALQRDFNTALRDARDAFKAVKGVLDTVLPPIKTLIGDVGGLKNAVKLMIAAWGAWKIAGLIANIKTLSGALLGAEGAAGGLATKVGLLSRIGPIAIPVAIGAGLLATTKVVPAIFNSIEGAGGSAAQLQQALASTSRTAALVKTFKQGLKDGTLDLAGLRTFYAENRLPVIYSLTKLQRQEVQAWLQSGSAANQNALALAGFVSQFSPHAKAPASAASKAFSTTGILSVFGFPGETPLRASAKKAADVVKDINVQWAQDIAASSTKAITAAEAAAAIATKDAVANSIFNSSVAASVANAKTRLANAIRTGNEQIAAAQQSLGNFILSGQQRISSLVSSSNQRLVGLVATSDQKVNAAAVAATSNLSTIANKLIETLGKFYAAGGGTQGVEKGALSAQFVRLKSLLMSGGSQSQIANAAQLLSQEMTTKQAKAMGSGTKALAQQQITTFVDEFNKGQLTARGFQERLLTFLKSQGVTYKSVGTLWGQGLRDGMWAEIQALMKQLQAIGAEPSTLRALSRKAAATGGIKVVDPNAVRVAQDAKIALAHEQSDLKIARAQATYDRELVQKEQALVRTERKAGERVAAARHAELLTLARAHLRTSEHAVVEHRKAVALLKKSSKAATAAAATNAALAGTQVNGSAFRTSPAANPGKASRDARATATGGLPSG